jgi:hypothetical protein
MKESSRVLTSIVICLRGILKAGRLVSTRLSCDLEWAEMDGALCY